MDAWAGDDRVNKEWVTLNAIRGVVRIATKSDMSKGTYANSLDLGGELYPELLGPEHSVLRRMREGETAKEYRQRAELKSLSLSDKISPVDLLDVDIAELQSLIGYSKHDKEKRTQVDQLKKRLGLLEKARVELSLVSHSENKLIFRDAYNVDRDLPEMGFGLGRKDYQLPDGNFLRLRVLHPDRPEHITGADIIYERHDPQTDLVSVVIVQYKIWDDKKLYISDKRMLSQLDKMRSFSCGKGLCENSDIDGHYRFPCCAAFLRPTDKLQNADQKFISTGEHLPICRIDKCKGAGARGGETLEYEAIKSSSLSSVLFEELFNRGKIGSKLLTHEELRKLYESASVIDGSETVVIYAQEY